MIDDFPLVGPWEPSPINVAGVILRDHSDRILLQLRDINERTIGPGLWSFFGGHVEGDEDLKSAAVREFIEETGITLSKTSLTPVARAQSLEGAHLYAFAAKRTIDPSEIRLGEGAGFRFSHTRSAPRTAPCSSRRRDLAPLS